MRLSSNRLTGAPRRHSRPMTQVGRRPWGGIGNTPDGRGLRRRGTLTPIRRFESPGSARRSGRAIVTVLGAYPRLRADRQPVADPDRAVLRPPDRAAAPVASEPRPGRAARPAPGFAERLAPWIFAAKTTAAALLAMLAAFRLDLDQPY